MKKNKKNCESKWINAIRSLRKWIKMNQNQKIKWFAQVNQKPKKIFWFTSRIKIILWFSIHLDESKWVDSVRALRIALTRKKSSSLTVHCDLYWWNKWARYLCQSYFHHQILVFFSTLSWILYLLNIFLTRSLT